MSTARVIIEVTAGVLPPEVQMTALCGRTEHHGVHGIGPEGDEVCLGVPTQPTGWQRHRPEREHTLHFVITSEDWNATGRDRRALLEERNREALDHAAKLMAQPDRFNHVRVDWIWL